MKQFVAIGCLVLGLASCKSENAKPEMGYEFFPASLNSWVSYQVDSVWFSEASADTFQYQIKELVESEFMDDEGRPARRIERYFRLSEDQPWQIKDIWKVIVTSRKVEKVEENIRYVRLNFPVKTNQYWDGNTLNTFDRWDYSYAQVGESATHNETYFHRTATVQQQGKVNLIEQERGEEIYAENVGLIYKYLLQINTQVGYTANPIPQNINNGYEVFYHYLDHGQH